MEVLVFGGLATVVALLGALGVLPLTGLVSTEFMSLTIGLAGLQVFLPLVFRPTRPLNLGEIGGVMVSGDRLLCLLMFRILP